MLPCPGPGQGTRPNSEGQRSKLILLWLLAGWGLLEVEVSSPLALQGGPRTWLMQAGCSPCTAVTFLSFKKTQSKKPWISSLRSNG